jgi:dipeptidyl aminopeptidase/acylaminoacyl peptidase
MATPAGSPAWIWNNAAIANGARIPVETYLGPMLLAHGDEDTVSPIERAENIADARERTRDMLITETELFAGEGHTLTKAGDTTRLRDRVAAFFLPHL